jgi:predicted chitinase
MNTGWIKDSNGKWTYYNTSGVQVKSDWVQTNSKWYYLDANGIMITSNWLEYKGKWYYMGDDGATIASNWKQVDSKWYYFDEDGAMYTGWYQTAMNGESWYFSYTEKTANHVVGEMATGWVQINTDWYYLSETEGSRGVMYVNGTFDIGGTSYIFNSKGAWVNQTVTAAQLEQVGWYSKYCTDTMIADLNNCCSKFEINTAARLQHFISQCAHESGCGYYMVEEASGNAYEGRTDLGNTQAGDGPKFKGGGYIQLTGRSNYQSFANYESDQEIVNEGATYVGSNYPWSSAGYWWYKNNMNSLVDSGATCTQVSAKVNCGYSTASASKINGLSSRQAYYAKCCEIFS